MSKTEPELKELITKAFRSPQLVGWDPNKNPVVKITVQEKAKAHGLILPPGMQLPSSKNADRYEIIYKCDMGTVEGKPAYQVTGACDGVTIIVAQGFMTPPPAETKH